MIDPDLLQSLLAIETHLERISQSMDTIVNVARGNCQHAWNLEDQSCRKCGAIAEGALRQQMISMKERQIASECSHAFDNETSACQKCGMTQAEFRRISARNCPHVIDSDNRVCKKCGLSERDIILNG